MRVCACVCLCSPAPRGRGEEGRKTKGEGGGEREAAGLGSELWLSWLLPSQLTGSSEAKLFIPLPQAGWLTPA